MGLFYWYDPAHIVGLFAELNTGQGVIQLLGHFADLAALDPAVIGHVQLCDVPMPAQIESYMEEALYERRAPGDGDLPLADFVELVPEDVPIGLETPIRSEAEAGIGPEDRPSDEPAGLVQLDSVSAVAATDAREI